MATVNDVLELAKALEGKAVVPAAARCVAVRNRNATCQRCVDACIAHAIRVKNNEVTIDNGACVACGACVAVCPTEAMVALEPVDDELAQAVAAATTALDGKMAVIACARVATHGDGDPEKFAKVPCLGRVEELMLVELAARSVGDIVLVDGGCETCKYRAVDSAIDATVGQARVLLEAQGASARVKRMSEFPSEARMADEREQFRAARRSFLSNTSGMAKDAAMIAAEQTIKQKMGGQEKKTATIREKLGVSKGGKLPAFRADRNMRLLDAMYELGESVVEEIDTRVFGRIDVDAQACTGCGMCTMFCPTGAVRASEEEHPKAEEGFRYLEFSTADCVQCGLCVDACMSHAITLSTRVKMAELFDFEPRLLDAKKPAKKQPLFGRRH